MSTNLARDSRWSFSSRCVLTSTDLDSLSSVRVLEHSHMEEGGNCVDVGRKDCSKINKESTYCLLVPTSKRWPGAPGSLSSMDVAS